MSRVGMTHGGVEKRLSAGGILRILVTCLVVSVASGSRAQGMVSEHVISPKTTDSAISTAFDDHYVYVNGSVPSEADLFVFLPGTGGKPADTKLILQLASTSGFHAIGLMYPANNPLYALCPVVNTDPECHGKIRREIVTGEDASTLVSVSRADSIENRLIKLLQHLATAYPTEGWGNWIVVGEPNWRRIRLSGWSQGGGHAAYIGKSRELAGVIAFSSPQDWDLRLDRAAPWIGSTQATPPSRYFGFSHVQDATALWVQVEPIWSLLGMASFGSSALVDGAMPPYGGAHQLKTNLSLPPLAGSRFHSMTIVDRFTPRDADGTPTYAPVWRAVAFWKSTLQ